MIVKECKSYHARMDKKNILWMPDEKSVFKVYYMSIIERDKPEQYEWEYCPHTQNNFERIFLKSRFEGVGFIISFPHITKVFRFSPDIETILDVKEFQTQDLLPINCLGGDGSHEFACYAESIISADEYSAWAKARTIDDYIKFWSNRNDFHIENNTKLKAYWQ